MKQKDKDLRKAFGDVLSGLATFAVAMALSVLFALLFAGCTNTKYVPVESVTSRTDTVYSVKVRVDSVKSIERIFELDNRYDSVAPILDSLNRVIGWDRYHFRETTKINDREMERLRAENDSLKAVKRDSVERMVPYPVERPLTSWEQTKMDFGGMAIGGLMALGLVVIAFAVWLIKVKRRR